MADPIKPNSPPRGIPTGPAEPEKSQRVTTKGCVTTRNPGIARQAAAARAKDAALRQVCGGLGYKETPGKALISGGTVKSVGELAYSVEGNTMCVTGDFFVSDVTCELKDISTSTSGGADQTSPQQEAPKGKPTPDNPVVPPAGSEDPRAKARRAFDEL